MGDIEEVEEQKMAHFLSGMNYNIYGMVELYPFSYFYTLCSLCLKFETQTKRGYEANSSLEDANTKIDASTSVDANGSLVVGAKMFIVGS